MSSFDFDEIDQLLKKPYFLAILVLNLLQYLSKLLNIIQMKKIILSLGVIMLCAGVVMAQGKKNKKGDAGNDKKQTVTNTPPATNNAAVPTGSLTLRPEAIPSLFVPSSTSLFTTRT